MVRRLENGNVAHGCEMCDGEDECTCRLPSASVGSSLIDDLAIALQTLFNQVKNNLPRSEMNIALAEASYVLARYRKGER